MSDVFGNGAVWMGLQLLVKASMLVAAALVVQWADRRPVVGCRAPPLLVHRRDRPAGSSAALGSPSDLGGRASGFEESERCAREWGRRSESGSTRFDCPLFRRRVSKRVGRVGYPCAIRAGEAVDVMAHGSRVLYAWGALVLLTYLAAEQLSVRRLATAGNRDC